MFKVLFLATLLVTLVVNIIFLFATKDKPPDLSTSTFEPIPRAEFISSQRRLFLRSNDFYDYSGAATGAPVNSIEPPPAIPNSSQNSATILAANSYKPMKPADVGSSTSSSKNYTSSLTSNQVSSTLSDTRMKNVQTIVSKQISGLQTEPMVNDDRAKNSHLSERESFAQPSRGQVVGEPLAGSKSKASFSELANHKNDYNVNSLQIDSLILLHGADSNPQLQHHVRLPDGRANSYDDADKNGRGSTMNIRVKSSKNHVFVSVNDLIIYESKSVRKRTADGRLLHPDDNEITASAHDKRISRFKIPLTITTNQQDDVDDLVDDADGSDGRGVHVVVLNEYHGYVMAKRVFDTYSPGQDEELCFFINMIRDGRILIFAIKDEGSFKMAINSPARDLLQKLGSEHIMKLRWRDMWAFVVRKSTPLETNHEIGQSQARQRLRRREEVNFGENLQKSSKFTEWAPAVILDTKVKLLEIDENTKMLAKATGQDDPTSLSCSWSTSGRAEDQRRLEFCSKIEGYGRVCDCNFPTKVNFSPTQIKNSQLDGIPIIVMASNRPHYLYRMLRSLLAADGVNSSMVTVFIDGFYEDPLLVSQLFNLRAVQQRPLSRRSARISHHYKASLTAAFEIFPKAEFAIIFEEDLDVAQDALIYFNETLDLLRQDGSLYCASAWNDQGYEHSTGDSGLLYRIETMPGLGWMLSRQLYKQELEPIWPAADQPHDWDMWIRTQPVRRGRECIIPDISRTFHFGSIGTNINSYFQRQYFSKHAFNLISQHHDETAPRFRDLDKLAQGAYERHVEQLISGASVVDAASLRNSSDYLCSLAGQNEPANLPRSSSFGDRPSDEKTGWMDHKGTSSVIYIEMIDEHDFENWLKLAKCWRIWDLDARGQHRSMWRLFLAGRPTFVVGVPASPYARFKPAHVKPFKF